jgi:hypothetical protein
LPKSRNRYARAQARARYRKPKRRKGSFGWNVGIGALAAVGIAVVAFTVVSNRSSSASGLALGDHWHAALGVNVCGQWEPYQSEFTTQSGNPSAYAGIHTHSDGLIHMEPQTSGEIGSHATIGLFAKYGGWQVSENSVRTWTGTQKSNGDKCPEGATGTWQWSVNGKTQHGNPADYKMRDGDRIVIAFLPRGVKIGSLGQPPSTANLATAREGPPPGSTAPPQQTTPAAPPSS